MARQKARVHNPAAETLLIVNGRKRGGNVQRKTNSGRARNKRRNTGLARSRSAGSTALARRSNSRRRRSRNPQAKGLVINALYAAVGAMGTSVLAGFVPFRAAGLPGIAIKFGVAYGFGFLAERFVNPNTAQMMAIGGAASAAGDLINYVLGGAQGLVTGGFSSPNAPGDETATMQGLAGFGDLMPLPADIAQNALEGFDDITSYPVPVG